MQAPNGAFTFELWIYPTSLNGVILDETDLVPNWHTSFMELVNGSLLLRVWNVPSLTVGKLSINTWYQVVMSFDGYALNGYINGELKANRSGLHRQTSTNSTSMYYVFGIGDNSNMGSGASFTGNLRLIRFYKTILTPTQVLHNYNVLSSCIYSSLGIGSCASCASDNYCTSGAYGLISFVDFRDPGLYNTTCTS